jgi:hypothetical protein
VCFDDGDDEDDDDDDATENYTTVDTDLTLTIAGTLTRLWC